MASDSLNENSTVIAINIRDVNDLPPVFLQKVYKKIMNEGRDAPYRIIQVNNTLFPYTHTDSLTLSLTHQLTQFSIRFMFYDDNGLTMGLLPPLYYLRYTVYTQCLHWVLVLVIEGKNNTIARNNGFWGITF